MTPAAGTQRKPISSDARRVGWLIAAPALGLLLYWRVPFTWFQDDDFAWLSLGRDLHEHGWLHVLFHPFAQGTVRLLDRAHFLAISGLFGSQLLPYRVCGFATWIIALILVLLIGERLTGSLAAGGWAALVWAANANSTPSIVWISAYYQLLCAACLLGALYSRLRCWRVAEWVCYLAAFGVSEITPMYAVIAVVCAAAMGRKRIAGSLWLFAPAAIFTVAHFLLVPKSQSGPYVLSLDWRLPSTIAAYLGWIFEPGSSALRSRAEALHAPELLLGMLLGLTLGWFAIGSLLRRQWTVAVFCIWFVALLAPVLLLPNHVTSYYLTVPSIGLAWLAGWGIERAWADGGRTRLAGVALAAAYFVGSAAGIQAQTRWFQQRSNRMREVVEGVAAVAAAHPGTAIALEGMDDELYQTGFEDHPFLLVGVERVWRFPGDISEEDLHAAVAKGQARVLEIRGDGTVDITDRLP